MNTTENMTTTTIPIAKPVGNFGKDFDCTPRPVNRHPFVCECVFCKKKHEERKMEQELVKIRYGF